jgi:hypothetical protein
MFACVPVCVCVCVCVCVRERERARQRTVSLPRSRDNAGRVLQELAAVTGKPRFTRRSLSLRQHGGRSGFPGVIRSRQASLELSCSPARSALLPEVHTPPAAPRKSNWEVIEHFSSSSGSLTRGSKASQSANLVAVSPCLHKQVATDNLGCQRLLVVTGTTTRQICLM